MMKLPPLRHVMWRLKNLKSQQLPPAPVLVTGASGRIGTWTRPTLCVHFKQVRLSDRVALPDSVPLIEGQECFQRCNLKDAKGVAQIVAGVEQIVHLGAISTDGPINELSPINVSGVTHLFNAAIEHGVKRVVLFSTMHVLGRYRRDEEVSSNSTPRPDCNYALTKLYAENLARFYHERYGISVVVIRPGHVTDRMEDAEPNNWTNSSDVARLIQLALTAQNIGFEIWHAVTAAGAHDPCHIDLANRFGFHFSSMPAEDIEASLKRWYPNDEAARIYRGGTFAAGKRH